MNENERIVIDKQRARAEAVFDAAEFLEINPQLIFSGQSDDFQDGYWYAIKRLYQCHVHEYTKMCSMIEKCCKRNV